MNKFIFRTSILAAATLAAFTLSSCSDSNDDMMMDMGFQRSITFENVVTPKDFVESGSFQGTGTPPIILPGQSVSVTFSAGKTQALMFATMVWSFKRLVFCFPTAQVSNCLMPMEMPLPEMFLQA